MGVSLYGVHIDSSKESMLAAERRKANRYYKVGSHAFIHLHTFFGYASAVIG